MTNTKSINITSALSINTDDKNVRCKIDLLFLQKNFIEHITIYNP